jgi:hypothetical protein
MQPAPEKIPNNHFEKVGWAPGLEWTNVKNRKSEIKILYFYFTFIIFLNVLLYWPSISCSGGLVYEGQDKAASPSIRLEHRHSGSPKHQQVSVLGLEPNVMNYEWKKIVTNCCDTLKWGILLLGRETVSLGGWFPKILRNVENYSTNDIASHPKRRRSWNALFWELMI